MPRIVEKESEVVAPVKQAEVWLSSMSILKKSGAVSHVLLQSLTMGLDTMAKEAAEDGARLAYEPLRGFTWARLQLLAMQLGLKRDESLKSIGAILEPARSETGVIEALKAMRKEPSRASYVLYYYVFEPLRFKFGKVLEKITKKVRETQDGAEVPVRVYGVTQEEKKLVTEGRSTELFAVLTPYAEHLLLSLYGNDTEGITDKAERIRLAVEKRNTTPIREQVENCARIIEEGQFDGMSLNIVGFLKNEFFSDWKEALPLLFKTTVIVKGKELALVQMLELQTDRTDLNHDILFDEAKPVLEEIAKTGWKGPVLFAPGSNVERKGKISWLKGLFGKTEVSAI